LYIINIAGYSSEPKLRRRVSPLGEPPSAAEIRSQDHSAARASRTATRMAFIILTTNDLDQYV
jgi:hypothetical protein